MKYVNIGGTGLRASNIVMGCMRLSSLSKKEAEALVRTALEQGINLFDHADIYGGGSCEEIFAEAAGMNETVREKMILQSKCSIRDGYFDFSKEYLLHSVDGILKRLHTDYLDILLLHRPDPLMEPEEVAEAIETLHRSGKVRYFGVSNQNPMQMQLLQKYMPMPIAANQIQLSLACCTPISAGIHVNTGEEAAVDRDGSVLDYCRLNDITIQPWSPFQYGFFGGVFLGSEKYPELNAAIDKLAEKYGVSNTTIALAWLLRHPARLQPIVGTMNLDRLRDCLRAPDIVLTRQEWYDLYLAAGNTLP